MGVPAAHQHSQVELLLPALPAWSTRSMATVTCLDMARDLPTYMYLGRPRTCSHKHPLHGQGSPSRTTFPTQQVTWYWRVGCKRRWRAGSRSFSQAGGCCGVLDDIVGPQDLADSVDESLADLCWPADGGWGLVQLPLGCVRLQAGWGFRLSESGCPQKQHAKAAGCVPGRYTPPKIPLPMALACLNAPMLQNGRIVAGRHKRSGRHTSVYGRQLQCCRMTVQSSSQHASLRLHKSVGPMVCC